jgi:hypothetical protein
MTQHPCHGRTKRQIAAFERIAVGDDAMLHPATVGALVNAGLVELHWEDMGSYRSRRYHVPTPIHAQWCQWCDENVTVEEIENTASQSPR